jgi:hypothetical protein
VLRTSLPDGRTRESGWWARAGATSHQGIPPVEAQKCKNPIGTVFQRDIVFWAGVNTRPYSNRSTQSSVLALLVQARSRHRVVTGGVGKNRGRGIHAEVLDARSELVVAVEDLIVGDDLAGVGGHAPHRGDQTGAHAAIDLVVGLVVADGFGEVFPLHLVGVGLLTGTAPDDVLGLHFLTLVNTGLGGRVAILGDDGQTLAAVGVAGELIMAARNDAAIVHQLGTIGEGVLDRVVVEVLIDVVATVVAPTGGLGHDGPGVLDPAALVDVVDVVVVEGAARGPQEAVEALDLPEQLAPTLGLLDREPGCHRAVHAIAAHTNDVAGLAVADAVEEFATDAAMAAHQANADLDPLLQRLLVQVEHAAGGRAIDSDGLLHEHVDALFNGILVVHPAEGRRGGEDGDVLARGEQVDGLLVALEINETTLFRNIHAILELALQALVARLETVLEHVGHTDELDRAGLDAQRIGGSTGSATTRTHQDHVDRIGVGHVGGAGGVESSGGNGGGHRLRDLTSTTGQEASNTTGTGNGSGALQEITTGRVGCVFHNEEVPTNDSSGRGWIQTVSYEVPEIIGDPSMDPTWDGFGMGF